MASKKLRSQKRRGTIGSMMLMDKLLQENDRAELYSRDIHSAFNSLGRAQMEMGRQVPATKDF